LSQANVHAKVIPFTLPDDFGHTVGKKEWMLEQMGLSPDKIYERLLRQL
jgi:transketolase C-terminal domain/subunit